jgi:hypothetical protein
MDTLIFHSKEDRGAKGVFTENILIKLKEQKRFLSKTDSQMESCT